MRYILRHAIYMVMLLSAALCARGEITLEYCLDRADHNYPLIRQYGIVEKTTDLQLSDINKSWLPQASIYVQGTVQNVVPSFPDKLVGMMEQLGEKMQGLGKLQYKVGVDLNQTIWDGGKSAARRESARASLAADRASLDVGMYALRDRVQSLFFGILLIQEQIAQTEATLRLLESNLEHMRSLQRNGVAMPSDVDIVEAQKLTVERQLTSARGNATQYRRMLGVFIGEDINDQQLARPDGAMPQDLTSDRPELHLFDARKALNNSRLSAVKASVMPAIGLFAQAYYGYPGMDYFASMRNRDLSFNVLAGVKVSWNISSLYTRRNDIRRITLANEAVDADRDKFLFDSGIASTGQLSEIETMRKVMADDERIAGLRANVRRAAESQLRNGVIDANDLLAKITDENQANLTAAYHDIELLRLIYQLKNTLNR